MNNNKQNKANAAKPTFSFLRGSRSQTLHESINVLRIVFSFCTASRGLLLPFFFLLYTLNFLLVSCQTTEPPIEKTPPETVKNTITIQVTQTTHRSITVLIKSTYNKPAKSIELYRRREDKDTLVESSAFTLEKEIIDDDSGKGLVIDTEYKYYAVRVDTVSNRIDTSEIITARTLPSTSHDYIWEEFTLGEWQSSLWDVWGTDENNVYAVGGFKINDDFYGIFHWDGTNWNPIADAGGRTIFGFSENDIWVAGGGVFHYDGNKWNQIDSKLVNNQAVILDPVLFENSEYTSIWGTSSENMYLGNMWGKIVHWDGGKGKLLDVKASEAIRDLWGLSSSDIYAAAGNIAGDRIGELYKFDGLTWDLIKKGSFSPGLNEFVGPFNSVWSYNKEELYLAGNYVYKKTNSKWEEINMGYLPKKIRGDRSNNIFVSGPFGNVSHYNGVDWHRYRGEFAPETVLTGIYVHNDMVFIVGDDGTKAYIYIGRRK